MALFGCRELINIGGRFVAIARWMQEPCCQIGIWIWNKRELSKIQNKPLHNHSTTFRALLLLYYYECKLLMGPLLIFFGLVRKVNLTLDYSLSKKNHRRWLDNQFRGSYNHGWNTASRQPKFYLLRRRAAAAI